MDKRKYYYEDEKLKLFPFIMVAIGVLLMIFFTVLKIKDPDNWAPYGYLMAMGFTFLWTWGVFGFAYYITIKPRAMFLKEKKEILNNGKKINGEIIDAREEIKTYVNGKPSEWRYYVKVKVEDNFEEKTFWTPALLFNPANLLSKSVLVCEYNNKYFVEVFQISDNPIKTNDSEENNEVNNYNNTSVNAYRSISTIITGLIITGFCLWVFIQAADVFTRVSIIPFMICGIGVLLTGLLPLIFGSKKKKIENLGMKIYLLGFSIFWFGFLVFFDYLSIKQGSTQLVLYSLIFWIVGIYTIVKQFKRLK